MINQAPVGSFMANLPHRLNILEFFSTGPEQFWLCLWADVRFFIGIVNEP